jgi:hypothetical protein
MLTSLLNDLAERDPRAVSAVPTIGDKSADVP